jgi:Helix-turn-helix domain
VERREGKLTGIGEILDRNIILKGADILTAKGFTQVPNHVLVSARLSPGAKLTYAMLLKYAWQNDYCFPGQERLANDMGVTDRSVRTYLQELERERFVGIKQRGLGRPNLYELNLATSAADRKIFPVRTGKNRHQDRKNFPTNNTQ